MNPAMIPRHHEDAARSGIDLMLCGHTHNGRIVPFNRLVKRYFPRIAGRCEAGELLRIDRVPGDEKAVAPEGIDPFLGEHVRILPCVLTGKGFSERTEAGIEPDDPAARRSGARPRAVRGRRIGRG